MIIRSSVLTCAPLANSSGLEAQITSRSRLELYCAWVKLNAFLARVISARVFNLTASDVTCLEDLATNTKLACRAPSTIARVPSTYLCGVNGWRRSHQRQKCTGWVFWSSGKPAGRPKRRELWLYDLVHDHVMMNNANLRRSIIVNIPANPHQDNPSASNKASGSCEPYSGLSRCSENVDRRCKSERIQTACLCNGVDTVSRYDPSFYGRIISSK